MHHASVRIGLFALFITAGPHLLAQGPEPISRGMRLAVGLGTTVPSGYALNLPAEMGYHAQLFATWQRSTRLAFRVDGAANLLSATVGIPSCPASGAACTTFVPHPDQAYSATVSAELRRSATDRVYGLIGGGAYYARGPHSTSFGTTGGAVVGLGAALGSPGRAGFALEARYHYLPAGFGTLNGMFAPSLVFRF